MTRERFTKLVEDALKEIPRRFRKEMRNVAVVVEDEPSQELLDEMEIEPGDTLFGLYQGTPLPERELGARQQPARPHLDLPEADRRGLRDRRRDPRLRRRDRHPRVRPLLRDERGRDRGDRGEVLARRVDRAGVKQSRPRKRFGQHFLAPAWADKVVDAIAPAADDRFLEIGPGPGVLTHAAGGARGARDGHRNRPRPGRGAGAASFRPTSRSSSGDVLDVDLADLVAPGPLRVAGNLPYNISSPILFKLLATARASANLARRDGHAAARSRGPARGAGRDQGLRRADDLRRRAGRRVTGC